MDVIKLTFKLDFFNYFIFNFNNIFTSKLKEKLCNQVATSTGIPHCTPSGSLAKLYSFVLIFFIVFVNTS